ncbi:NFX1-type zinc finger-containing protein 1 [Paraphaeosphaeria sporulosa]|uniref:NFX1-type zinc finger-containing protein 1 n=1 Tax=Paraphaeosphaeria sporulosa TaxID=1460663 RepID=A0A177C2E4_9PLEO|nr:NFX1-type zinc finger-containing protein 1 [Paraphaeosphaeria sporulosa]OAG00907.1 NFX1-type zinc finger-containing protein 1 [Paraphaeosphaeria sporulosa]
MRQPNAHGVCRFYQQRGSCRFGETCKFSHDLTSGREKKPREEETVTQQQARGEYNYWKRFIKSPPRPNDEKTSLQLWSGALQILDGDEREWKQMLPRDFDNEDMFGRDHIKNTMAVRTRLTDHHGLIDVTLAFLRTITHPAILDCLSIETYAGSLYNFVTGANGKRAIPFFQHVCEIVGKVYSDTITPDFTTKAEQLMMAMCLALREILRREPRARFNEDLPALMDGIENLVQMISEARSQAYTIVARHIGEMRAVVDRANGLLAQEEEVQELLQPSAAPSSYPRTIDIPRDRHDNDKADISQMEIFPTREEIMSDIPEFLPLADKDQPHFILDPAQRHVDTNFRLLRYDTFGELKEALGNLMHAIEAGPEALRNPKLSFGDFRAYHYTNTYISYLSFDQRRGLEVILSFPQLQILRGKSATNRRKWKEHSLTNDERQATITAKLARHNQEDIETLVRLSCEKTRGVLIEFPGVLPATFMPVLRNLQEMNRLGRLPFQDWILPGKTQTTKQTERVDVPPPLYARGGFHYSLEPIIKTDIPGNGDIRINPASITVNDGEILREIEERTQLDFGQCRALLAALSREFAFIQGPPGTGKSFLGVQLMKVLMECRTRARLGPIVVVCYTNHALDQFLEHLLETGIQKVVRLGGQSHSTVLENHNLRKVSQAESKTRSESYILGKSYDALENESDFIKKSLGRVHVASRGDWKQLQFHLRMTHPAIHQQFPDIDEDGFKMAGRHPFDIWASTDINMLDVAAEYAQALPGKDALLAKAERNVHSLSRAERAQIRNVWAQEIRDIALDDIFERVKDTERIQQEITNVHDEIDRRVLQNADVIGITTTGLAKRIATLQRVRCKVVICEEAGEVMEPHMISALLPAAEHFIQIGDHEQLRPQINNFKDLSLESRKGRLYQLDRSQFERLSVGEPGRLRMPVAQLNVQRRMRPDISRLIRETIYPDLVDHATTAMQPDVVGMRKNVFWVDHDNLEDNQQSDMHHKSHSNQWEVDMVHAMVRHIVRQGAYKSSEIAVLTPYTGQLQKLRAAMRSDFEIVLSDRDQEALEKDGFQDSEDDSPSIRHSDTVGHRKAPLARKTLSELLRVATVDNFQGEEAKVIIISLVRSNNIPKVGFLKTTNRINVLLSRAQHGMYLFGNSKTYSYVPMWEKVLGILRASESVGTALELCCPRHPETPIQITQSDDFSRLSPEGGCREACPWRLPDCGHMCKARCHSETMHAVFSCPQPCQRLLDPCNHLCQKSTCGEDCGRCLIKLDDVELPCGHFKSCVPCYMAQVPSLIPCTIQVERTVPECNHLVQMPCGRDVKAENYKCPTPCSQLLKCGHPCHGTCGQCKPKAGGLTTVHQICQKICGRKMAACNHTCGKPCHEGEDCGTCSAPCEVRCKHSKCTELCSEPCAPCIETCTWGCEHQGACMMPCSAPCNRLPCDVRCSKILECGHQCPGLCGESCPESLCHKCTEKRDSRVDLLEMLTYAEIDVNENPIVVLGCGHFFTAESLDGLVGLTDVYTSDKFGQMNGLADISRSLAGKIPQCPDCQAPVRQYVTQRYNRVINRAVIDELSKRFLVHGKTSLRDLETRLHSIQKLLDDSRVEITRPKSNPLEDLILMDFDGRRADHVKAVSAEKMKERYRAPFKLGSDIAAFLKTVADRHQPARKLHEATIHAIASNRSGSLDNAFSSLAIHEQVPMVERDRRVVLGGRALLIKTESMILEDKFHIAKAIGNASNTKFPGGSPTALASAFLASCKSAITESTAANIPKLAVELSLYFANITQMYQCSGLSEERGKAKAKEYVAEAKVLLKIALESCKQPFQNAEKLKVAVEESLELLHRPLYEEVTAEELAMIKAAMVSGPRGIATHSGHWYNCANGHPFAIGECGMPMQLARCPECGAPIGGSYHTAVAGVTRAVNMEQ